MSNTIDNIHVKLQQNDEYRRFIITRSCKFIELCDKIKSILNLKEDFALKYKDEEEEWITISSDMELETGLLIANGQLFRLQISLVSSQPAVKEPTTDAPCDNDNDNECEKPWRKYRGRRGRCGGRGGGRSYRKWQNEGEEEKKWKNEECEEGLEENDGPRYGKKWKKHYKKMRKFDEGGSSSEENNEDALLNLEEIKTKVEKLKSELKVFKENSDKAKDDLKKDKVKLKELKSQDPIDTNAILETKKIVKEKKAAFWSVFKEVKFRRNKIYRLKKLAESKKN